MGSGDFVLPNPDDFLFSGKRNYIPACTCPHCYGFWWFRDAQARKYGNAHPYYYYFSWWWLYSDLSPAQQKRCEIWDATWLGLFDMWLDHHWMRQVVARSVAGRRSWSVMEMQLKWNVWERAPGREDRRGHGAKGHPKQNSHQCSQWTSACPFMKCHKLTC